MSTKRKEYRLPDDVISIIEQTKKSEGYSTDTETLIHIVRSYIRQTDRTLTETDTLTLADAVIEKFHEKYKKPMDRIRLASTFSERYSYMILDALNTYLYETNVNILMPASGETKHLIIKASENNYKAIIERNKQIKDNDNKK